MKAGSTRWVISFVAFVAIGLGPLAGQAMAQAGTGTGNIVGQVVDESQGVLPGVTVTATSPALQVPQVVGVTDARGEYRMMRLPIGTYAVTYSLIGFSTLRREDIILTNGFTARLDVVLTVGAVEESVTVTGESPVVDVASTQITTHVTQDVLDVIPTGRNHYTSLLELAPGAKGNIDVGGSTNNGTPSFSNFGMQEESWQAVDGISTKTPNISDSGNFPDFTTIEEAAVSTMGHDATVPSRGVNINTVIKSGGNDLSGTFMYGATGGALEWEPERGGALVNRYDIVGQMGGPIIHDKLWVFAGARYQYQERDVVNCLKPDGTNCTRENGSPFFTPKATFQLNPNNKIIGMAWFNERIDTAIGDGGLVEWSARRNWGGMDGVFKGEWQGLISDNTVVSLLGGMFWNHSGTKCDTDPSDSTCSLVSRNDRRTGRTWGLSNRSGERNQEERRQIRGGVSWYKADWGGGNHEIKVGSDFFNTPANRRFLDRGAAGNYRLRYANGVPDRIDIYNSPVFPDNAGNYIGFYAQDSWTIGRQLTLNLGLRYARDSIYENEGCRDAAVPPGDVPFPDSCWEKTQMPILNSLVPRLRAAYDLTGDGTTVVKGGWGRYVRMRLFDHLQPIANNVITTAVYRWRDEDGNDDYTDGEVNLDPNGPDFLSLSLAGTFETSGRGIPNPDEQQVYTDEFSAQFERQLIPDLAIRVTGIHARVNREIRLANALRPYEAYNIPINSPDPGPDGVEGTADDTGNVITWYDYPAELAGVDFQQGIYVNDSKANQTYNSMELAVSKRLSNNYQFSGSYALTKLNIPLTPNEDEFNTQDPNAEIFAENDTYEWLIRLNGSYRFPYGILFAARYEGRSGDPWARTAILEGGEQIPDIEVNVEPIGSQRLEHVDLVTLRGEKGFNLGGGNELMVRLNLHNLLNDTAATSINSLSGSSYGRITGYVLPRIVNFEVEYRF